jgi:hypothetical protein
MLSIKKVEGKEKKALEVSAPKRRKISTVTGFDKKRAHRRAQAIEHSKRRAKEHAQAPFEDA